MTKKLTLVLSIFSVLLFSEVSAQQNVYFTGVGRALVTNDELKDGANTASKLKSSGGYTMFDLGIYAKPNEVLRGGVILRLRNEFGGFFGDGGSLQFRQMLMEGLVAKKVKYELGDVYLTHTRYTLWNEDPIFRKYEANAFSLRRDIVNYENFFVGNAWRMQGFNTKAKIGFSKVIDTIGIRVYGGRTMPTDFAHIPDRYFYGGRFDLKQSQYFRIAGNVAGISDIAGTVTDAEVDYNNIVYTTDFGITFDKSEKFKFALIGELGSSQLDVKRDVDTVRNKFDDFFYDAGIEATYKPLNLVAGISYRDVGFNFNSPMAQTRRMYGPGATLGTLPALNDDSTARQISLYDTYSQEYGLYNQSISTTLMPYFVQFNMVEPYGKATPNRTGITAILDIADPKEFIKAGVEVNMLGEGVSEGDSTTNEKRKFQKIQGGFVFNLNKVLDFEKVIAINAGYRSESSIRGGTNAVNLSSTLYDIGLDIEVVKDLHVLGGAKMFAVKGNEYLSNRDELNQITGFGTGVTFNQTQNIIATGLRYDYDKAGYFSMHYHMLDFEDKESKRESYNLSQLFFVFGLKF